VAIDQAMTMLPHWFSTMFPVTFLVSAFHSALAMTALLSVIGRGRARLHDQVTGAQFHDLGKLIFAYSVFWMYVNWSQYVVIWYGLLPHEQEFFVLRFQKPFSLVTEIMVGCVFVIPFFFLLTRPPKKVPPFLAFVSVIVLVGHWLERFLITVPSVWQHDYLPLGLTEIGVALGFAGLFFGSVLWFLTTFPVLPSPASLAAIPAPVFTLPPRSAPAEA
jgi:formate-dependent nitrite reductase membrane component NrfD